MNAECETNDSTKPEVKNWSIEQMILRKTDSIWFREFSVISNSRRWFNVIRQRKFAGKFRFGNIFHFGDSWKWFNEFSETSLGIGWTPISFMKSLGEWVACPLLIQCRQSISTFKQITKYMHIGDRAMPSALRKKKEKENLTKFSRKF